MASEQSNDGAFTAAVGSGDDGELWMEIKGDAFEMLPIIDLQRLNTRCSSSIDYERAAFVFIWR